MRRLLLLALVGCGTDAPAGGSVSLVLDIPNGALDPPGYTTVEIAIHDAGGATMRTAVVDANGRFDLGDIDPRSAVAIEAVLRNDNGAAVGYGRTASVQDLEGGATITVQVRRPILYIAGANYTGNPPSWFGQGAMYSDLSTGAVPDGTARVAVRPMLMVSAGPQLYAIDQAVSSPSGTLTGSATIQAVSTADHAMGPMIAGAMTGAVQDGAGSDDGGTLVIGTNEKLFVIDTRPEAAVAVREIAAGNFGRVAIVAGPDGSLGAVAIRNRIASTGPCNPTAELWWVTNTGGEVIDVKMIAMGGFADVASDRGRAWYVDACKGEFGEVLETGVRSVRTGLGRPTALAVSNGQAWIGIERTGPVSLALEVTSVEATSGPLRTLWSEPQEQVLAATDFPGVERRLTAQSATFQHLEVGAGGDYVAAATTGTFHGDPVLAANFPRMDIQTEELRVFDAASGGNVQRYRSWCDGSYLPFPGDIDDWRCAITTGQTAPGNIMREHRIQSMTFLFGKK